MPKFNFRLIVLAALLYVLCSGTTFRDRILIATLHNIRDHSLAGPSSRLLFEGAMHGMFVRLKNVLGDEHSLYIPNVDRKEYEEELDNRFEGIGILFYVDPADPFPEIAYPILHSPAFRAGLRSGDRILRVDGKETAGLPPHEISQAIKGLQGKQVVLTVQPFGRTEPMDIVVERAPILRDSVEGDGIDAEGNRTFVLATDSRIGYVRITSFSERTPAEALLALRQLEASGAAGLILDLRNNSGGYVDASVRIANFFIRPEPGRDVIVSTRYHNGRTKHVYRAHDAGFACSLPMVVLIDGESASSSEILAACLQDYDRAVVVGTRSFGKGVIQRITNLPLNSGTIQLTDASYWRPSDRNIHRAPDAGEHDQWGVTPDDEGLVPISDRQRYASIQIRDRRANAICENTVDYLAASIRQLYREIERLDRPAAPETGGKDHPPESDSFDEEADADEGKTEAKPFVLEGNEPYFDPQLDRAMELLKRNIGGETKDKDEKEALKGIGGRF